MPSRASAPFIRLTILVFSLVRLSRSRLRRLSPPPPRQAEDPPQDRREMGPLGLGPPVLARDCDAGRVNDVALDPTLAQPARQPEPVATGLEGQHDPPALPARLSSFR